MLLSHDVNTYIFTDWPRLSAKAVSISGGFKQFRTLHGPFGLFLTLGKVDLSWMDMGPYALDSKYKTHMWSKG